MTQIRLRRDTSANFTSKNPVLGNGEPAYETDTKKLKIGDGTTAYTSLAYFAGGGGSAEFNVVQPLKLVDGTLTLQIDEQTIQVQNGKLVANLDELGNEVNTLAGDVAGVQADLLVKENKITTIKPISLIEKKLNNFQSMQYTTDNTAIYGDNKYITNYDGFYNDSGNYRIFTLANDTTPISERGGFIAGSIIKIPYTFGQIAKIPYNDYSHGPFGCKTLPDGSLIPIVQMTYNQKFVNLSDRLNKDSNNIIRTNSILDNAIEGLEESIGTTQWGEFSYIQVKTETDGNSYFYYSAGNNGYRKKIGNSNALNKIKEIDCIAIIPYNIYRVEECGVKAEKPFKLEGFGLYNTDDSLSNMLTTDTQPSAILVNQFDLTKETVKNYLELNIGSGLSVVDNKLTANGATKEEVIRLIGSPQSTVNRILITQTLTEGQVIVMPNSGLLVGYYGNSAHTGTAVLYLSKVDANNKRLPALFSTQVVGDGNNCTTCQVYKGDRIMFHLGNTQLSDTGRDPDYGIYLFKSEDL